jgi:hypothetical protein
MSLRPLTRPLTAVVLACGLVTTTTPPPATAGSSEYGRVWRKDGTLRQGCHDYRFQYRVKPRAADPDNEDDWAVEFFLVDPRRGRGTFEICRQTTVPGRFTIRGKLSVYDDGHLVDEVRVQPGRFRLRRA